MFLLNTTAKTGQDTSEKESNNRKQHFEMDSADTGLDYADYDLFDVDANLIHAALYDGLEEHLTFALKAGVTRMVVPGRYFK